MDEKEYQKELECESQHLQCRLQMYEDRFKNLSCREKQLSEMVQHNKMELEMVHAELDNCQESLAVVQHRLAQLMGK